MELPPASAVYVTPSVHSPSATIVMQTVGEALGFVVGELSDNNYAQSLDFYRFWLETGGAYLEIPSDQIFDAIWDHRRTTTSSINASHGQIFHASAQLIVRFASDAESDHALAPHSSGLQNRLCARSLREFSSNNLMIARYGGDAANFYVDANLIAHWANLGYVEEAAIRNHILQSLISHPTLYIHQAFALIIMFKLAGATLEAYANPSVIDRCIELLKSHSASYSSSYGRYDAAEANLKSAMQVRRLCASNGGHRTNTNFRVVFKR